MWRFAPKLQQRVWIAHLPRSPHNRPSDNTMVSTDTSLADVPVALPTKRGRGRRPVRESRRGEIVDAVTAWKMTPLAKREPPTLTELAAKLGATKHLVHYYYKQ